MLCGRGELPPFATYLFAGRGAFDLGIGCRRIRGLGCQIQFRGEVLGLPWTLIRWTGLGILLAQIQRRSRGLGLFLRFWILSIRSWLRLAGLRLHICQRGGLLLLQGLRLLDVHDRLEVV